MFIGRYSGQTDSRLVDLYGRYVVKCIIGVIVILCLVSIATASYGQGDFYHLRPGEYGVGVKLGFPENATTLAGHLYYAISEKLDGYLGAALGFVDEDEPGVSVPPTRAFGIGFSTEDALAQTGLDYWTTGGFAVEFGKIIEEDTDETIMTSRVTLISATIGFTKEIVTESGLIFYPLAGISYGYTWVTLEIPIQMYNSQDEKSGIMDFSETEGDDAWSGQIGLIVEVSPKMSLVGGIAFSFEESDVAYTVGMLFHP